MKANKLFGAAVLLSVATCFMFFFYAPLELYFTNIDEFWYDIYVIAPIMFCAFLIGGVISVLGFALLAKWSEKWCKAALMSLFVVFICSYVQGNYLIKYLPVMNGKIPDWSQYVGGRIQSVCLWIAVIVITAVLLHILHMDRMYTLIRGVSACMLLMFAVTLGTLCITNHGMKGKTNLCVTTDYELTMSKDRNFVILLWDTLDGGAFSDIVLGDADKEAVFEDFTCYDNAMSMYPLTTYSLPHILSGMRFENQMMPQEYFDRVLTTAPLFRELEDDGYVLDLYDLDLRINGTTAQRFENVGKYTKKLSSYSDFARWQVLLVGMKYAPFDLKRFSFVDPRAFEWLMIPENGSEALKSGNNMQFYRTLSEKPIEYREGKCFKFIHMWGAHPPYEYDGELNYLPSGATCAQSSEMCITLTDLYLRKLKESGVYDNSVIIVMSDHGNGEYYEEDNMSQHATLLIKGINEKHPLQVNERPVSFDDLQSAYLHLLDGGGQHQHLTTFRFRTAGDSCGMKAKMTRIWWSTNRPEKPEI